MISFVPERLANCVEEIRGLASAHYLEAGRYSPAHSESVDWDAYLQMDALGVLLSVIVRDDGVLVGYWGGIQHSDMHSAFAGQRILALSQVVWYMLPSYRRVAKQFCRAIERVAAEKGCSWVSFGAWDERTDALRGKIGYIRGEFVRVKVLDNERPRHLSTDARHETDVQDGTGGVLA